MLDARAFFGTERERALGALASLFGLVAASGVVARAGSGAGTTGTGSGLGFLGLALALGIRGLGPIVPFSGTRLWI